jgi:hypothetical protein
MDYIRKEKLRSLSMRRSYEEEVLEESCAKKRNFMAILEVTKASHGVDQKKKSKNIA